MLNLLKKEFSLHFKTPALYLLMALFVFLAGIFFTQYLIEYFNLIYNIAAQERENLSLVQKVYMPFMGNLNFLLMFICPLISARLFSSREQDINLQFLALTPLKERSLVLCKYLFSLMILLSLLFLIGAYFVLGYWLEFSNMQLAWMGLMGLFLQGSTYLAIGCFCSNLSRNPFVSSFLSILIVLFLWSFLWASFQFENEYVSQFLSSISFAPHLENFFSGFIAVYDIVYYICLVIFFLFLTISTIQLKRVS